MQRASYSWSTLEFGGQRYPQWDCSVNLLGPKEHHIMRIAGYLRGQMPWYGPNMGEWPARVLKACEIFNSELNSIKDGERKRG